MAKITKTGINPIVVSLDLERDLETRGQFEINELVRREYKNRNYQDAPTSAPKGQPFNGLQVSIADMRNDPLTIWLAKTRYYFCKAMREVYKKNKGTIPPEELRKISPKVAHVSIKSLVKEDGQLYIPCHIRGKGAHGTGQLLSVLAAGGIDPKHLSSPNPLVAAIVDEVHEELGITDINLLNPNYTFDLYQEEEVGRVNLSMYSQGVDLNFILTNVTENNRQIQEKGKRSEIAGIALMPFNKPSLRIICDQYQVGGVALLPFDKSKATDILNQDSFTKIPCYVFDQDDPSRIIETNYKEYTLKQTDFFRPITQATLISILKDPGFMDYYREQSGC